MNLRRTCKECGKETYIYNGKVTTCAFCGGEFYKSKDEMQGKVTPKKVEGN